jgi:hypothetical protein
MGDTKRGREHQGRNKRHQRLRREMERDQERILDDEGTVGSRSDED